MCDSRFKREIGSDAHRVSGTRKRSDHTCIRMGGIQRLRIEPKSVDGGCRIMVIHRITSATQSGSNHDLRKRIYQLFSHIGLDTACLIAPFRSPYFIRKSNRREVNLRIKLFRIAAIRTHLGHKLRRERPPYFKRTRIDRENRRIQFVCRHVRLRIVVEVDIVRVVDRTSFFNLILTTDPTRIEEPVCCRERCTNLLAQRNFCGEGQKIKIFLESSRAECDVRAYTPRVNSQILVQSAVPARNGANCLEPHRVTARILEKRKCTFISPIGVHETVGDVEMLLLDAFAGL